MSQGAEIRLCLAGPLRVVRRDGVDLTPRSAKAQGLLALLGSAPGGRRNRTWLQDRLWSDRGSEQGAASLRQSLVELRRSLGECRDCLITDAGWVGLNLERVAVQIDPEPCDFGLAGELPEFAEGLDVRDPEFEHWIRDQRASYAERLAAQLATTRGAGTNGDPREAGDPARAADARAPAAAPLRSVMADGARPAGGRRNLGRGAVAGLLVLVLAVAAAAAWLSFAQRDPEAEAARPAQPSAMPSVAVLQFSSLGGSPTQDAMVVGVTRDIITDLSKFGGLFVVAADTSFRFADLSLPSPRAAEASIAVRYSLSGSVQWLGEQVRVNAQLAETETGRSVWGERFDRPADDLLELQNEIARRVVGAIGPVSSAQGVLRRAELDRLARIPTGNLQAYDHFLQGVMHYERFTPDENLLARQSFARATALDPGYSKAYAMATWTYLTEVWDGSTGTPGSSLAAADALAERALEADPGEAYAYWALGAVRLFQRRHGESVAAYRRAVELNPNGADLLVYLGWALTYAGEPDEGLALMHQAIERNPYHPGWYLYDVAWGHFVARRYQAAVEALERRHPKTVGTHELLALCYAMLGREAEAARAIAVVLEAKPQFSVELAASLEPFAHDEDLQHYVRALRAAGVPERAG